MTCYLIGYVLAFVLTFYSTLLEGKWFKTQPMTPMDVILMAVCSLLSWFWVLIASLQTIKLWWKKHPEFARWFHEPIFKKPQ